MESSNDVAYKLMQAFMQLNRQRLHATPIAEMRHSELVVLRNISRLDNGQGVMVSELSALLKVSAPSITQTVNSLVKKELVRRCADSADRRAVRLFLTDSGVEKLEAAFLEFKSQFQGLVNHMGKSRSQELIALLEEAYEYFESN
ncbi:MarR family transcriptional regulator [Proteinivorax hydrogeniformans]|uniref:MarR family transcriptional regulator n=1 Tax=Proteinivorax hydrogeniformans TaxID=1826727 RepID=A0AAU8HUU2_9FIRM